MTGELLNNNVLAKLHRLRAALRTRLMGEGLSWVLLMAMGLMLASLGLDYALHLEKGLRAGVLVAAFGVMAFIAWRQLIAPLAVPMEPADLSLLLEKRHPDLADRLISAIQFGRRDDLEKIGYSLAMIQQVSAQANHMAATLDIRDLVERKRLRQMLALTLCGLGLIAGLWVWQSDTMNLWFKRNVLFASTPWPQKTYLEVVGGPDFTVVRGDDLKVAIVTRAGSAAPAYVTVHAEYPSIGETEDRIEHDPENIGNFTKVFQAVSEKFDFYVAGGDDETDRQRKHTVTLIDPPSFQKLTFTVEYPGYMNRKADTYDGGSGVIPAPIGSTITIEAVANKDLRTAKVILETPEGTTVAAGQQRQVTADMKVVGQGKTEWAGSVTVAGANRSDSRVLRFALEDTAGFTNRRGGQYMIQVLPDLQPIIDLKKRGIGAMITAEAIVPLIVTMKDDCGVASAKVMISRSIATTQPTSASAPAPTSAPTAATDDIHLTPARDINALRHDLSVQKFGVRNGEMLRVFVRAWDIMPPELKGPNHGDSGTLEFRVVPPEELMADLVRRQKELRVEFIQAVALQANTIGKTKSAMDGISQTVSADVKRQVAEDALMQSSVGNECAKAADTMQGILDEMVNNRLGKPTDHAQIAEGIITPLRTLVENIKTLAGAINTASTVDDAAKLKDQLGKVGDLQKDIQKQMEDILQRMQKMESRQELANQLQIIIQWSEELMKALQKQKDAEVGNIFNSTSGPATIP